MYSTNLFYLLAGPKPASTCIRSESVGLLGADGESIVMGGRVIALLPVEGLLLLVAEAGGDKETTALGGGGSGREDGMPIVIEAAVVGERASSGERVCCKRKGMG